MTYKFMVREFLFDGYLIACCRSGVRQAIIQSYWYLRYSTLGRELIRIGSNKKPLKDFPEQERQLWRTFDHTPFEDLPAVSNLSQAQCLALLDHPAYFQLRASVSVLHHKTAPLLRASSVIPWPPSSSFLMAMRVANTPNMRRSGADSYLTAI